LSKGSIRVGHAHEGLHAAVEGQGELAFGAAVGAAGDDPGPLHDVGEGDVELERHEGAGGQAGHGGPAEIDRERRQRLRREDRPRREQRSR
jgi:hypothetical protein